MKRKVLYYILLSSFVGVVFTGFSILNPPLGIAPYFNGVFPKTPPGKGGSWRVVDAYPEFDIISPLRIIPYPNSNDYLVLSKAGMVWKINIHSHEKSLILDISDRTFNLGEGGSVGFVLHPDFRKPGIDENQYIFIFYRTKPDPAGWSELGYNRLSKFSWNPALQEFDANSEEVLFQQYDRCTWHNGGGMFFRPDGFLYLTIGDEGFEEFKKTSNQRLDGSLFGGLLRIDVDNDLTRSHPIRRQPGVTESPPEGWYKTFSQGYSIPNDNPWLSENGDYLEEFYAIGMRSPYSTYYDSLMDRIWVLDVGKVTSEEISILEKGDNLQWPFMEGTTESANFPRPEQIFGKEKAPVFEFGRDDVICIIGGGIYRGERFLDLSGKFLVADFGTGKIMALQFDEYNNRVFVETLISDIESFSLELPDNPGITGVHILNEGEVLITVLGNEHHLPGKILKLQQNETVPDPPADLSETGIFKNLQTLQVSDGIIPYSVNSPLWSDRAVKERWMIIPNKPNNPYAYEKIVFREKSNWRFPEGTVFIKQFNLPTTDDLNGPFIKLETRLFIIGENNQNYGLTYKWNEEGTDATLLRVGDSKQFNIYTESGDLAFEQTWDYPNRDQCLRCHNSSAGYVLGVKTHQLNGMQQYDDSVQPENQLTYLSRKGIFDKTIGDPNHMLKSYALDNPQIDLETRIRSYWDVNCSFCHLTGGIPKVSLNMPYTVPITTQNIINVRTSSPASDPDNFIVRAGDHAQSELWVRDASLDDNKMPPIGRNLIDQMYLDSLAKWIDSIPPEYGRSIKMQLYPNPTHGFVSLRLSDTWEVSPYKIEIFGASGQILFKYTTKNVSEDLNLSHLTPGVYFLRVTSGDGQIVERKFVLN